MQDQQRMPYRRARRGAWAVLALVILSGAVWVLRNYEPGPGSLYPQCAFFRWTGLHCPGCGATRALRAMAHGDLRSALQQNAMLVAGLPLMLVIVAWQRQRERHGNQSSARLAWALLVVLLAFFVLRNVPTPTRAWLAPPPGSVVPDGRAETR